MPITIPDALPARKYLEGEGLVVMRRSDAVRQDIRPLQIALLNLMPEKEVTELQFTRLIGATPLQVELTLLTTGTYTPRHVSRRHLLDFYQPWSAVRRRAFDGLIVTGAPVETLPYGQVAYWDEMAALYDWTQTNVFSTLNVCWGAQAALWHFHRVPKHNLPRKMFGLFPHRVARRHSVLLRGFPDTFLVPVSRHSEVRAADLPANAGLDVLCDSPESGLCLLRDRPRRQVHMFNHLEYDADTLRAEYERDLERGVDVPLPRGYFPGDDPSAPPPNVWRALAHLLVGNWLNDVYQQTPFDLDSLPETLAREAARPESDAP